MTGLSFDYSDVMRGRDLSSCVWVCVCLRVCVGVFMSVWVCLYGQDNVNNVKMLIFCLYVGFCIFLRLFKIP